MNFQEMTQHAIINKDAKYHRVDDVEEVEKRDWYIEFDVDTGQLKVFGKDESSEQRRESENASSGELYIHDFTDGDWEVYTEK